MMRKIFNADKLKNDDELNAFFDRPRAEPCYETLDELMSKGSKNKGAVIKLYLENFKAINETFGYNFGGQFLREIVEFLCALEGADVYRTAGVKFVVILNKCKHAAAIRIIEEIADRFERTCHINDLDCMCSVNLALAYYPGYAGDAAEMMDRLNYALSVASMRGPNQYCVFDEALDMKLYRRNAIARLIPNAIENDMLDLRHHPIYHTETRRLIRVRSYLRMHSPEFGILKPAEFMPIAEESGQIYLINHYMVDKACQLFSTLTKKGIRVEKISVPISPIQFLQNRFVDDVREAIAASGITAENLAFEISERIALNGFSGSHSRLCELSDMGIEIIFTEFGSGCSGISNILNMPVDAVKLERLLVWQIDNIPNGAALIEGLIHIAKNLKLKVVAEGVETQTQMEVLSQYGCDYQEGLFFSPSLTVDELIDALKGG